MAYFFKAIVYGVPAAKVVEKVLSNFGSLKCDLVSLETTSPMIGIDEKADNIASLVKWAAKKFAADGDMGSLVHFHPGASPRLVALTPGGTAIIFAFDNLSTSVTCHFGRNSTYLLWDVKAGIVALNGDEPGSYSVIYEDEDVYNVENGLVTVA